MKIYIEEIISNGIIAQNGRNGSNVISLEKAIEYGNLVVKDLIKKGIKAKLVLSDSKAKSFEYIQCDVFDKTGDYKTPEYSLNKNKNIDDLMDKFISNEPIEMVDSFANQDILQEVFGDIEINYDKTLTM